VKLSIAADIVVRLFSILSSDSRHLFGIFRTLSPPILTRFSSYKFYYDSNRSATFCVDLSSFLSLRILSFGSSRYSRVAPGIHLGFFGHFHRRFSRHSALIRTTMTRIAVRRSVWIGQASIVVDIVVRLFSIHSNLSRHHFLVFWGLSPPILARFPPYKPYYSYNRSATFCVDLSSFLSLRISLFGSSRYVQVALAIPLEFFGHFHGRFSRDSALISSTKTIIAVRRSVSTCQAFYRCGYCRSALLDTLESLPASIWDFSDTFTADSHDIQLL
jgi:hypothetical protein